MLENGTIRICQYFRINSTIRIYRERRVVTLNVPVTLGSLSLSMRAEFSRVLLLLGVCRRYLSWMCVVRLMRAPVVITTVIATIDVDQGVSSPLMTAYLLLVVSTIRGIVL